MAKISINCRGCAVKNCIIKKEFRETANRIQKDSKSLNEPTFSLKCSNRLSKFEVGDVVKFTIAYGRHTVEKKWKCNGGDHCDECREKYRENCNDGIVTFYNRAYSGNVEVEGVIVGYRRNLMTYAIAFHIDEYKRIESLFTPNDMKLNSFNADINYYLKEQGYVFSWWSKRKFIKETGRKILNTENLHDDIFPF